MTSSSIQRVDAPQPVDAIDPLVDTALRLLAARNRTEVREALADGVHASVECESVVVHDLDRGGGRRGGAVPPPGRGRLGDRHVVRQLLVAEGEAFGSIEIRRRDELPFLAPEHDAITMLANLGALALLQISRQEELEDQTRRDWMTGLFNAAHCHAVLEELCASGEEFALALLDFDDLKRINDTYGHQEGDEMLRVVGVTLRGLVRANDFAFRLGGDEFAVVLRGTRPVEVAPFAARVTHALRELQAADGSPVTLSFGHAVAPADGTTPADLLRVADVALYAAKRERKGTDARALEARG